MIVRQCLLRRFQQTCVVRARFTSTRRTNPLGIQMLSSKLHKQLFGSVGEPAYAEADIRRSQAHLRQFDLGSSASEVLEDIELDLPPFEDADLNEHVKIIAEHQSKPYADLIRELIGARLPTRPSAWQNVKGWTKCVLRTSIEPCRTGWCRRVLLCLAIKIFA